MVRLVTHVYWRLFVYLNVNCMLICNDDDDDATAAEHGSEEFEAFLQLLGERITLKGWERFRGGLDVKGNITRTEAAQLQPPPHPQQIINCRHVIKRLLLLRACVLTSGPQAT